MVMIEFSIFPVGKGESLSRYVARALDIVDRSGLDYRLHAMGTVIEGEWDEVFGVVKDCFEALRRDCRRVSLSIKVDYRRGARSRLSAKVNSVQRRVGRRLKTA